MELTLCRSLSVLTAMLPGEPVLAGTRISQLWILSELRMMEVVVTAGANKCAKLQSNDHNNKPTPAIYSSDALHVTEPTVTKHSYNFPEPVRTLRSSSCGLLSRNRTRTVIASRAFKHSSVFIWNSIPADIRNCDSLYAFRRHLKTFLFNSAFAT